MIVEDDKNVRKELAELLHNSGYDVVSLSEFHNSKEEILNAQPDLVLLDINIPYLNGEFLLKELRRESDVPVIMVTSRNTEVDEVLSMSYGADDYITKPYNPTLLLLRINNIFKRVGNTQDVWDYEDLKIDIRKGTLKGLTKEIVLTKNEMLILSYLLSGRGKIVTRDELMTELWNNEEYINDNALTVNISRLRTKLKSLGYEEAIDTRKGQGYILK